MNRAPHQPTSNTRSAMASHGSSGRLSSVPTHASRHASRRPRSDQRTSAKGSVSDYEDVIKRQPSILKKKKYFEDGDYSSQKRQHQDPIYRQPDLQAQKRSRDGSKPPPQGRHATFHESTNDQKRRQQSGQNTGKSSSRLQSGSSFKSLSDWKKSVAHLLDKSQLSAVDRFRRRTLAFRTAVCIGLVLATAAVISAIMGTVYYVRLTRVPQVKPKVFVLASINGTLRLLDMPFSKVLEDPESAAYDQLEQAICSTIRDAITDSSSCSVAKFRNGSVIADFQFKVNLPSLDTDLPSSTSVMPNRRDEIMANITSKRLSKLGHKFNLFIDPEFKRQPEVDLFMSETSSHKVVRIADVQPVVNNKEFEEMCDENITTSEAEANYFPDATDCRAFLVCDGNQLYRLTCGEGTAWNDEETTCDFKSNTNCTLESDGISKNVEEFDNEEVELPNEEHGEMLVMASDHSKPKMKGVVERIKPTPPAEGMDSPQPVVRTAVLNEERRNAQVKFRSSLSGTKQSGSDDAAVVRNEPPQRPPRISIENDDYSEAASIVKTASKKTALEISKPSPSKVNRGNAALEKLEETEGSSNSEPRTPNAPPAVRHKSLVPVYDGVVEYETMEEATTRPPPVVRKVKRPVAAAVDDEPLHQSEASPRTIKRPVAAAAATAAVDDEPLHQSEANRRTANRRQPAEKDLYEDDGNAARKPKGLKEAAAAAAATRDRRGNN